MLMQSKTYLTKKASLFDIKSNIFYNYLTFTHIIFNNGDTRRKTIRKMVTSNGDFP